MRRNYENIGKDIALKGFFSEYLPPCFKLDDKVLSVIPEQKCDLIYPLCFTMSRFNSKDGRRNIFLPEIGSYLVAYNYIQSKKVIKDLIEFSETSSDSFSHILGTDNSIMTHEQAYDKGYTPTLDTELTSLYIENICKKIIKSSGANSILRLDISNCFASFYTHMIPAIILGYDLALSEYNNEIAGIKSGNITYKTYQKLDDILRRQNLNRTNGLLVGTLYSKIIIEGILCRIDKELKEENISYSRYVDDYEIYLYDDNRERVISIFERILKKYGFSLNFEKIEAVDYPFYVVENLQKIFTDQTKEKLDSASLMKLFNTYLSMEKQGTKGAIRFLLKSMESQAIETDNKSLYRSYLISIMTNDSRSLVKACSLLLKENIETFSEHDKKVFIEKAEDYLAKSHDLEVVWLLYLLCCYTLLEKADPLVNKVCKSSNELAQLILLRKGLLNESNLSIVKTNAKSWIILYELYASDYIDEATFVSSLNLNKNIEMYKKFKRQNIHFCSI